jgi:hypothetical protein
MMKAFRFLEGVEAGGDAPVEEGIETCMKYHHGRGVALVLSDFLTFGDVQRAFNLLFSAGLEPLAIQILSPGELAPDLTGDLRLVDCETQTTLDVSSANDLADVYQGYRLAFESKLGTLCRQRSGRFVSISSQDPLDGVLLDLLLRKGWVQ